MSFSRVKPDGYLKGEGKLLPSELNQIDENQSLALDGTAGGYNLLNNDIILEGVNGIELQDGIRLKYEERVIEQQYHHYKAYNYTNWTLYSQYMMFTVVGQPISIAIPHLPDGNILSKIELRHRPNIVGRAALPDNMPWFAVYENYLDDSAYPAYSWVSTAYGPYVDPSANVAAFETDHWIPGVINLTLKKNSRLDIKFTAESGANSAINGRIHGIRFTYLVNQHCEL